MQPTSVARQLDEVGHMVLDDLSFDTGSSTLSEGPFPSLEALAEFLKEDSSRRIVLVGHTDTLGSLDANIRLSQRRAASVRARLISAYGIKQSQMDARGAGYLAPVTSNATEAGRNRNRRVEVVLLEGQK